MKVEWPSKANGAPSSAADTKRKSYCYLVFDNEKSVRGLLSNCSYDESKGEAGRSRLRFQIFYLVGSGLHRIATGGDREAGLSSSQAALASYQVNLFSSLVTPMKT